MFALAVLATATSFAYNEGDYAYNATQRFKIVGPNLVTNGNFANGRDGWYSTDKETSPSADVWDVVEGAGPNGETVIQSIAPTAGQPFCNSWTFESANTYVVSFDIKAEAAGYITTITGGSDAGENACDFFLNGDGAFVKAASTDEAPVTNVAAQSNYPAGEWRTLVFFFTADAGKNLVMHFEKLAAGIQFTNVEIHQAEQVYDIRVAQNRIAFAKELMEMPEFNTEAAQEAKANLQSVIESIEAMIESGEMDDQSNAEAMMSSFDEEGLEPFLAVTSVDAKTLIPGLDIASLSNWGRAGAYSANYKLSLSGNWGHMSSEQNVLRSAIQTGYAHSATYKAYHEDFPAGKYFFSCEVRNANTDKTSWPTNPTFNLTTDSCLMFIGTDTITTAAIEGEEFQRFSMVADVKEDGQFYAGIYWPGVSSGGAFFIRNTIVRAFNTSIVSDVEHIQAFKTFMTQWNAATSGRQTVHNKIDNANYPWGQNELKAERDRLEPYYIGQHAKGWYTAEGTDAGVASTDELTDWALYQGIEEYNEPAEEGAEPTRKTYQLVRGYQAANNAVVALNKVITDLGNAIDAAKKTRNTGAYLTGDRETYKAAILAALNTLTTLRATTTDATREADSTTFAQAKETLDAATATFLASVVNAPIVDIDFSDPADPTMPAVFAEDTSDGAIAAYYVEGKAGRMYFGNVEFDSSADNMSYALGYGEELNDVLHVGSSAATVLIPGETGDNDVLSISFDFWQGYLVKCYAQFDLQNADNTSLAKVQRYVSNGTTNSTFGVSAANLENYITTRGSSSIGNAGICVDANKVNVNMIIDYKNKTQQITLTHATKGTFEGEAVPFEFEEGVDNKIAKFVLSTNYTSNAPARRCWFDNLKISRYATSDVEEDITEKTWADHTDWVDTGVKSINNAAADKAIYTLSGVRVTKASKPGMYIQNGKKFVIK